MKRFIFSIILLVGFSTFVFAQDSQIKKDEKEITACPIKLLVGAADFHFSYRYIVKTDETGLVSKITKLNRDDIPKFVKDEEFVSCIESWKLNPSEEYFVSISVATIFTDKYKNHILISNKKETIKIFLPDIGDELIVEEKKK